MVVAIHGGGVSASVHAGIHTHTPLGVGLETPHGVGLETPPARPLNFPPGCGPGDPLGDLLQGMLGYHPSGDLLQGMLIAGIPPAMHAGIPPPAPPVNRMTDRCKNITLPQTSFVGNYS